MRTKKEKIHLEIQTSRKNPVGILRSSYYANGKTRHNQYGRIIGKTLEELKLLQLAFRGQVCAKNSPSAFTILESKEYGASAAAIAMIKDIGLDKAIYSKTETKWVKDVIAMIAGRLIYQGSKLSLCNQYENSSLWDQLGISSRPDVKKHCYLALDELLSRQKQIQKKLAKKHLSNGHLVLYDITSSYFEGEYEESELVKFGYNRDKKQGHEQVVIGLLCSKEGCPVGIEVYPGNTKDESTVIEKISELKTTYGLKEVIFVGDRGMVTKSNIDKLSDDKDVKTISALTRNDIFQLIKSNKIQSSLFDEKEIHEIIDLDNPEKRYCLCKNPLSAEDSKNTRQKLISLTIEKLEEIKNYKRSAKVETLGARIGRVLEKYKMSKYIKWNIETDRENLTSRDHKLTYEIDQQAVEEAELLDGCYIISSDVGQEEMDAIEVVASYKRLELVENAFRNLKTVSLEVRPVYHKKDERIKAHIFLCMLSYYVQWHIQKRLKPLYEKDGKGENRRWTFKGVIDTLKQVTRNKISTNSITFYQNTKPNNSQNKILKYLNITI